VPADRAKILREAYAKTLKDPDFLDEAKKKGWELTQLSQPEGQRSRKVNKNNVHNQKVSTTFWLAPH
jgi:hypothetical protein